MTILKRAMVTFTEVDLYSFTKDSIDPTPGTVHLGRKNDLFN